MVYESQDPSPGAPIDTFVGGIMGNVALVRSENSVLPPGVVERVKNRMVPPHEVEIMHALGRGEEPEGLRGEVVDHLPGEVVLDERVQLVVARVRSPAAPEDLA